MIEDGEDPAPVGGRRGRRTWGTSAEDRASWRRAMAGVHRLPGRGETWPREARGEEAPPPPPSGAPVARPAPAKPGHHHPPAPPPELATGHAPGLDKRTLTRLKRGLILPEATIDLHCLTQAEAHRDLGRFLLVAQATGRRCVLVVTGKGYGSGGTIGVLKTMVPRWLNEAPNRERVLAFCHPPAWHGGEGALYVLLRRRREPRG